MKFKEVKHYITPGTAHELTFSCFKKQSLLINEQLCCWFVQNLDECRNRGLFKIISYVLMPNHVHLLIVPGYELYDIGKILGSIKIPLTRSILFNKHDFPDIIPKMKCENESKITYRFWQRGGGYDRNLGTKKAILASINYMHANPIRKGLVENAEERKWSSASFYAGNQDYVLKMDNELLEVLT